MTLLSHPQVDGEIATLREAMSRHMPPEAAMGAIHILEGLPAVILTALQAGEGLDYSAVVSGLDGGLQTWQEVELDRQHKARVGALRQEIATLRADIADVKAKEECRPHAISSTSLRNAVQHLYRHLGDSP